MPAPPSLPSPCFHDSAVSACASTVATKFTVITITFRRSISADATRCTTIAFRKGHRECASIFRCSQLPTGGREEASDELEKAGEKVAEAAGAMPGGNKGREYVVRRPGETDRDEAHDPLMLAHQVNSDSEGDGMDPDDGPAGDSDIAEKAGGTTQGSPDSNATAAEEAQEAVAEVADVLKRAPTIGEVLRGAKTEEEIAQAAEILSDARISVIVAGQVLKDAAAENPLDGDEYDEIQGILNEANVAIVLAGETIYGLPDYGSLEDAFPDGEGAEDDLDQELEESLRSLIDRSPMHARRSSGTGMGERKTVREFRSEGLSSRCRFARIAALKWR